MANRENKNDILEMLSEKLGQPAKDIEGSAKSGNIEGLLSKLKPEQRAKVESLLNDPEQTRKILENPQVQNLIRKLSGNG